MYFHSNHTCKDTVLKYTPVSEYFWHFYTVHTIKVYNAIQVNYKDKSKAVFKNQQSNGSKIRIVV